MQVKNCNQCGIFLYCWWCDNCWYWCWYCGMEISRNNLEIFPFQIYNLYHIHIYKYIDVFVNIQILPDLNHLSFVYTTGNIKERKLLNTTSSQEKPTPISEETFLYFFNFIASGFSLFQTLVFDLVSDLNHKKYI